MSSYRIKDTEIEIMNYNENFLITFASTNSRFTAHNDLIQKYYYYNYTYMKAYSITVECKIYNLLYFLLNL